MRDREIDTELQHLQDQETEYSLKRISQLSKLKQKNANDRNQLFIMSWVGLGVILSLLMETNIVLAWVISTLVSAVYSYGFYKK